MELKASLRISSGDAAYDESSRVMSCKEVRFCRLSQMEYKPLSVIASELKRTLENFIMKLTYPK